MVLLVFLGKFSFTFSSITVFNSVVIYMASPLFFLWIILLYRALSSAILLYTLSFLILPFNIKYAAPALGFEGLIFFSDQFFQWSIF